MKAHLKLILSLFAVVIGFGSQWNCTIRFGEPKPPPEAPGPTQPPPSHGCVNQHPTYTLGESPAQDEYTIIVGEFKPLEGAEAHRLAAELRSKRVYNSVWTQFDGAIVVSVGRYWTRKQALDKLQGIRARGYANAYVDQPRAPKPGGAPPNDGGRGGVDVAAILAMFVIVVLVILAAASQSKNKS